MVWCAKIFLRDSIHNIPQKQSLGRIRSLITIKSLMSEVFVNPIPVNPLVCGILPVLVNL